MASLIERIGAALKLIGKYYTVMGWEAYNPYKTLTCRSSEWPDNTIALVIVMRGGIQKQVPLCKRIEDENRFDLVDTNIGVLRINVREKTAILQV